MEKKTIFTKLLEFQTSIEAIKKDGQNTFFKKPDGKSSTYATLPNILSNVKPILNALKLVLTQPIENGEVLSVITDTESGEVVKSGIAIPQNLNAQQAGSAITYFRRYTLSSLLSLEIDEDDDGNHASQPQAPAKSFPKNDDNKQWLNENTPQFSEAIKYLSTGGGTIEKIKGKYKISKKTQEALLTALQN